MLETILRRASLNHKSVTTNQIQIIAYVDDLTMIVNTKYQLILEINKETTKYMSICKNIGKPSHQLVKYVANERIIKGIEPYAIKRNLLTKDQ